MCDVIEQSGTTAKTRKEGLAYYFEKLLFTYCIGFLFIPEIGKICEDYGTWNNKRMRLSDVITNYYSLLNLLGINRCLLLSTSLVSIIMVSISFNLDV